LETVRERLDKHRRMPTIRSEAASPSCASDASSEEENSSPVFAAPPPTARMLPAEAAAANSFAAEMRLRQLAAQPPSHGSFSGGSAIQARTIVSPAQITPLGMERLAHVTVAPLGMERLPPYHSLASPRPLQQPYARPVTTSSNAAVRLAPYRQPAEAVPVPSSSFVQRVPPRYASAVPN